MIDQMQLVHLRREVKTALELAMVALAPAALLDRLGAAAGLLEAFAELPSDAPPVAALAVRTAKHARLALEDWRRWQAEHAPAPA
ncbi:MAG TPA: hypothetical protein VMU15_02945 [Anaeromyxobacter sp.]|nr:hypothetical protein [Anaeromyxobacter sp.]